MNVADYELVWPPDLFAAEAQAELFEADAALPAYRPDFDDVRARLQKILAEARAAEKLPWDRDQLLSIPDHLSANGEVAP